MLINKWFLPFYFDKDEGGNPQAGQGAGAQTPSDPTPGAEDETFDKARAMETIKKLRQIEKEHDKLVKAEESRKREQLSESDRIKAEKADLEKKLADVQAKANQKLARASVIEAAAKAGFNDPSDAWAMVRDELTIGEDGELDGLDKALGKLAAAKPYLLKSAGGSGGTQTPPPQKPPSPANPGGTLKLTADDLKKMSAQDIAKRWNDPAFQKEVEEAMKAGG